jgi:hypothetical protein
MLPSIASLKLSRIFARKEKAVKLMTGLGGPRRQRRLLVTHGLVAGGVIRPRRTFARAQHSGTIIRTRRWSADSRRGRAIETQCRLGVLSACNMSHVTDRSQRRYLDWRAIILLCWLALLLSHRSVASEAATRLTTSTVDRLKSNPEIGGAEALRQAMLDYLNDTAAAKKCISHVLVTVRSDL